MLAVLAVIFQGYAVYDYGLVCTRCLYYEHRIQPRLFGVPLWDYPSGSREDEYGKIYAEIFDHPCAHKLKTSGFGYRSGCGITAEGNLFSNRNEAVRAAFEAYKRVANRPLAKDSFEIIEHLFPEATTVGQFYTHDGRQDVLAGNLGTLMMMAVYLNHVETVEEWSLVNKGALEGFKTTPSFARDEVVLQAKQKSRSPIVSDAAAFSLKVIEEGRMKAK